MTVVTVGGASGDVSVFPSTLTFTSSTWNTAQTVTVTAAEDDDATADDAVTLTHTVSGADYDLRERGIGDSDHHRERHTRGDGIADFPDDSGGFDGHLHGGAEYPADGSCDGGRRWSIGRCIGVHDIADLHFIDGGTPRRR